MYFDGKTYDPVKDRKRLSRLIYKVWALMLDGRWRTLREISEATGGSEASVSARLRDFRKKRFGVHTVNRYRVKGGTWRYRIQPNFKGQQTLFQ